MNESTLNVQLDELAALKQSAMDAAETYKEAVEAVAKSSGISKGAILILIRGLPGSGKSTMAKSLLFQGDVDTHFEADMWLHMDHEMECGKVVFRLKPQALLYGIVGEYRYSPLRSIAAHVACIKFTALSLSVGDSVVVSNTFTRQWEMQPYIDMAADLGATVEIITATGNYGSVHGVPDDAIRAMRDRWEPLDSSGNT